MAVNVRTTQKRVDPRRLERVEVLLALQTTGTQVCRMVMAEFGVCEQTVRHDIARVMFAHENKDAMTREERRQQMRLSLKQLYQRCVNGKDYRGAGFVLDRICKLDGLYAPDNVNVNHTGVVLVIDTMTTAAKRERIQELLGKAGLPELPAPLQIN
jgi:hypothetical protein